MYFHEVITFLILPFLFPFSSYMKEWMRGKIFEKGGKVGKLSSPLYTPKPYIPRLRGKGKGEIGKGSERGGKVFVSMATSPSHLPIN